MNIRKCAIVKRSTFQASNVTHGQYDCYSTVLGLASIHPEFVLGVPDLFNEPETLDLTDEITLQHEINGGSETLHERAARLYGEAMVCFERFDLNSAMESLQMAAAQIGLDRSEPAGRLNTQIMYSLGRVFSTCGCKDAALACFQEAYHLASKWNQPDVFEAAMRGIEFTRHHQFSAAFQRVEAA